MRKIVSSLTGALALDIHEAERAQMRDLAASLYQRQRARQSARIEILLLQETIEMLQSGGAEADGFGLRHERPEGWRVRRLQAAGCRRQA